MFMCYTITIVRISYEFEEATIMKKLDVIRYGFSTAHYRGFVMVNKATDKIIDAYLVKKWHIPEEELAEMRATYRAQGWDAIPQAFQSSGQITLVWWDSLNGGCGSERIETVFRYARLYGHMQEI